MAEEFTHLRKSKPVMLAAGIIWAMIGAYYTSHGLPHEAEVAVRHNLLEPEMFAVLTMMPDKSMGQWLLVTLTAGVGGSLLSIGSAAGVALMGQARGKYTFFGHLKWAPVIALGYAASIVTHMWINSSLM